MKGRRWLMECHDKPIFFSNSDRESVSVRIISQDERSSNFVSFPDREIQSSFFFRIRERNRRKFRIWVILFRNWNQRREPKYFNSSPSKGWTDSMHGRVYSTNRCIRIIKVPAQINQRNNQRNEKRGRLESSRKNKSRKLFSLVRKKVREWERKGKRRFPTRREIYMNEKENFFLSCGPTKESKTQVKKKTYGKGEKNRMKKVLEIARYWETKNKTHEANENRRISAKKALHASSNPSVQHTWSRTASWSSYTPGQTWRFSEIRVEISSSIGGIIFWEPKKTCWRTQTIKSFVIEYFKHSRYMVFKDWSRKGRAVGCLRKKRKGGGKDEEEKFRLKRYGGEK